jgi:cytochrome bd-type quinol oxidase subunit 2
VVQHARVHRLLPIPLLTLAALLGARAMLNSPRVLGRQCWLPFVLVVAVFLLGALGLAYSLYPYVVMDKLTIWQAASATESAGRHCHRLRHHGAHHRGLHHLFVPRVLGQG